MTLTEAEQRFLAAQDHGRLATIARDGTPQVKPVGFSYNPRLGTIDIAGMNMARSAKYKNVQANQNVAFVADDVPAPGDGAAGVRFLEIRGAAETGAASSQVLSAAKSLSGDSGRLRTEVSKFLTSVRAT